MGERGEREGGIAAVMQKQAARVDEGEAAFPVVLPKLLAKLLLLTDYIT